MNFQKIEKKCFWFFTLEDQTIFLHSALQSKAKGYYEENEQSFDFNTFHTISNTDLR